MRLLLICLFVVPVCSYGQWSTHPEVNNPICTAPGSQWGVRLVSDGSGGAIITWEDGRSGYNFDIYAQRVDALGAVEWARDGVVIAAAAHSEYSPQLVSDGAGGAIIMWAEEGDTSGDQVYVQRVNGSGAKMWPNDGVAIGKFTSFNENPQIVSDGEGGAIIAWRYYRDDATTEIYAQRVGASGVLQWTGDGVAIIREFGHRENIHLVSDGEGGAIVGWEETRYGGGRKVYTRHVNAAGLTPAWVITLLVCTDPNPGSSKMVSDGTGGAIVAWEESSGVDSIYAQRVSFDGYIQWPGKGVVVSADQYIDMLQLAKGDKGGAFAVWVHGSPSFPEIHAQRVNAALWRGGVLVSAPYGDIPSVVGDGAGGAIIAWSLTPGAFIAAQRINASGKLQWAPSGVPVCTAAKSFNFFDMTNDGNGGAIIAWIDDRNLYAGTSRGNFDVYAQNVDDSGHLGYPPSIAGVKDVPNDHGGHVQLLWDHSHLDALPNALINEYEVYRGVSASAADSTYAILGEREYAQQKVAGTVARTYLTTGITTGSSAPIYWEFVGAVEAKKLEHYSYVAPTYCDSGAAGDPKCYFMVRACNSPSVYWESVPDCGYSVNNFLTGVTEAAQSVPQSFSLDQNYPNPFNPSTTIKYELPRASLVSLTVYDILGRQVSLLVNERRDAGVHEIKCDGSGLASGVYIYRLTAGDFVQSRKLMIVK